MTIKWKIKKLAFLLNMGTFLVLACFSLSPAGVFFSPDIPVAIGDKSFDERDIVYYDSTDFVLRLSGSSLGIPEGASIDAFAFSESGILFSVDVPITLDSETYTCRDLISYGAGVFSKLLDGEAEGIPQGACIDAATVLEDESIVFSLDILVSIGGTDYQANDLIRWNGVSFSSYFDGSDNGIPDGADIDGAYVVVDADEDGIGIDGDILISLDILVELDNTEFRDNDVIAWDQSLYSMYFEGVSSGLPMNAGVGAVPEIDNCPYYPNGPDRGTCTQQTGLSPNYKWIVSTGQFCENDGECDSGEFCEMEQADHYPPEKNGIGDACDCEGNFNCDQDVDVDAYDMTDFLNDFGREGSYEPCGDPMWGPCNGDFDCDVDVDADDMTKFLEDFGREDSLNPCPTCDGSAWCAYP